MSSECCRLSSSTSCVWRSRSASKRPRSRQAVHAAAASNRRSRNSRAVMRRPRALSRHVGGKAVTYAANRLEVARGGADFFAEPAHVRVDGAAVEGVVVAPDVLQQPFARLHATASAREELE